MVSEVQSTAGENLGREAWRTDFAMNEEWISEWEDKSEMDG